MFSTTAEIYEHSFVIHSSLTAVREDERSLTYREIWQWSDATMDQLAELGVGPGDVVGIFAGNRAEWLVADSAITRMGAVKTPANYMSAIETVAYQLQFAKVKAVFVDHDLAERLLPHLEQFDEASRPLLIQLSDPEGRLLPGAVAHVAQPPADTEPRRFAHDHDPSERGTISFTGGTTGRPKAVSHTRASNAAANYIQIAEAEIRVRERMLVMSPLAHAGGALAIAGIARGAEVRILGSFDAERVVELLISERITWTFMVPTMIYRVLDVVAARDDSPSFELDTILYGAAPMSPTRLLQGLETFGRVFVQLFGQTEAPQFCTRLSKLDHDPERPELLASCGNPTLYTYVKVTDDTGAEVPRGEFGEITVKAPFTLTEYIGNPEATAEKFWGEWVRTGDMGTMDEDGYVYLKDRRNDMIISGGFNVYSREVEDVLSQHPDVAQAAVIGIPHEDWGEAVHACVVLKDSVGAADAEALVAGGGLIAFSRDKLANYARPKTVELVTDLPQTAFGKIDKKALRAPHWEGRARAIG